MDRLLSEKLKLARSLSGISQKELSLLVGVSDKTISTYESGRTLPTVEVLLKISEVLKKPLVFFFGQDDEDTRISIAIEKAEKQLDEIKILLSELKGFLNDKKYMKLIPPNTPL